jgi:hypothetical protein
MPGSSSQSRRALLGCGLAALGLGACTTTPLAPGLAPVSYAARGAMRFAVARVDVVTSYVPPMRRPNIDHEVPFGPLETMQRWGRERLAAAGGAGRALRFVVVEAAMTETDLPRETGMRANFTTQQDKRYDLTLAAALELREEPGNLVVASGEARATRFRTVAEGIPIAEREAAWHGLLRQTMDDLDAELERQVRAHFAPFAA